MAVGTPLRSSCLTKQSEELEAEAIGAQIDANMLYTLRPGTHTVYVNHLDQMPELTCSFKQGCILLPA